MSYQRHKGQVEAMGFSEQRLLDLGIDLATVQKVFAILVDEGGLTWRALVRIVALFPSPAPAPVAVEPIAEEPAPEPPADEPVAEEHHRRRRR